jgi:hypothetical protein
MKLLLFNWLSPNLWIKLLHTFPTPLNYPIYVDKNANVIIWCPCKEQTMIQWLRGQRYYWKRDPTWSTTWPPPGTHMASMRAPRETVVPFSRETCENSREHAREPIDTAKAPFSRYLSDEGVTRGVATEVNV